VLLAALVGGSALFIGLKWRAVIARSEAAKVAGTKDVNYAVAPGRSGTCFFCARYKLEKGADAERKDGVCANPLGVCRWRNLNRNMVSQWWIYVSR